jgi:histidine utilization repressor, proteobacterial
MSSSKGETLNQRIRGEIESRILSGEWPAGHRIPFEHELMAQYGCSRMTVNKVLTTLAENGMIERRRRAGSFVARHHPHLEQVALEIPDIATAVTQRGHRYGFRLLQRVQRAADPDRPEEVALVGNGVLLELRSLHLADGQPLALEYRLVNPSVVPQMLETDFSDYAPGSWLLQHVSWTRGEHRISAVAATADEAAQLQVPTGTACLVIGRQTWIGEQPITWVRQMFLGDSYDLIARFAPGARVS